jgi:hypothetical protein
VPFAVPNSIRAMDVTSPIGSTMGFFGVDPNGNPSAVVNQLVNYGWEYVWHCHLLGHEENDMMRPMALVVAPAAPTLLAAYQVSSPLPGVKLIWMNNASNATTFIIQRATILDPTFLNPVNIDSGGLVTTFTDTNASPGMNYYYRVIASNVVGGGAGAPGYPSMTANSTPSNFLLLSGYQFYMPLINR